MKPHIFLITTVFCASGLARSLITGQDLSRRWLMWEGNNHWYRLTSCLETWEEAEPGALAAGGHLASIKTIQENQWLLDHLAQQGNRWIGLYQEPGSAEPNSGWKWSNGEPVTYLNWLPGEPNNTGGNESWTELNGGNAVPARVGRWNDQGPTTRLRGIIERPLPPPVPIAGAIVCWGNIEQGQCNVPPGNDYIAVVAGACYSLALRSDGSLVGWGCNDFGQATPPSSNDFRAIAAGTNHCLALRSDGSIVAWGRDLEGQGQSNVPPENDFVAIGAGEFHSVALRHDGSVVAWGSNAMDQRNVPLDNAYVSISTGGNYTLALRDNGPLIGWGQNNYGQLTIPQRTDFRIISAGRGGQILSLLCDASLLGWGRNDQRQLTDIPSGKDFSAIATGDDHSLALKTDGSVVGWGRNDNQQATPPQRVDFIAIAAGFSHSLGIVKVGNAVPVCAAATNRDSLDCESSPSTTFEFQLDGSQSYDPEGGSLTYMWTVEDCLGGEFDDPRSATPKLTLSTTDCREKTCTITLTVSDTDGLSSSCLTQASIRDTRPAAVVSFERPAQLNCLSVVLTTQIAVLGGEFGIAFDPGVITNVEVTAGQSLSQGQLAGIHSTIIRPENHPEDNHCPANSNVKAGVIVGWIFSETGAALPAGKHEIALLCFTGEDVRCSDLRFVECLGPADAIVRNIITNEYGNTEPLVPSNGTICIQPPAEDCCNGLDDDRDGVTDFADTDCANHPPCPCEAIPSVSEPDCNRNGIVDECDLLSGASRDLDNNTVPDECETFALGFDGICRAQPAVFPGHGQFVLYCTLTTRSDLTDSGAAVWSICVSGENLGILGITTDGTAVTEFIAPGNSGFRLDELVDPNTTDPRTGMPQGQGAISIVVLDFRRPITLPLIGEQIIAKITVQVEQRKLPGRVYYRNGLIGSGLPVDNIITHNGVSSWPATKECNFVTSPNVNTWRFVRGDSNSDGQIDLTDAILILNFLFNGGPPPACMDAADANDSGIPLNITDPIIILSWLFTGGVAPTSPSPSAPHYLTSDCYFSFLSPRPDCSVRSPTCE